MRLLGTTLSTSVQADRHGPSMMTRSPEARTRSNRSRNGPTCPPGLARMRISACAGGEARTHSMAGRSMILARSVRIIEPSFDRMTDSTGNGQPRPPVPLETARAASACGRTHLVVPPFAAQGRQPNAGGIKTPIDGKDLTSDVARAVAAQEEHRFGQFLFETVAI